jgi:PAT family beta-lactamase induction signal transducer AmpG
MLSAGAGALYLASFYDWSIVYILMSLQILIGTFAILFSKEPEQSSLINSQEKKKPLQWFNDSVIRPFRDFMEKGNWIIILLFVVLYKFGDALVSVVANPFYIEMGFSKIEIANVSKIFGLAATLIGAFIGGIIVNQSGIFKSLLVCGILQMLSNLFYAIQAYIGYNVGFLIVTIGFMDLASGMGTAAFIAYLSSLCNIRYTATQYALLSALASLGRTFLSSPGGYLVDTFNWIPFFIFTSIAAIPGIYLLIYLKKKNSQF